MKELKEIKKERKIDKKRLRKIREKEKREKKIQKEKKTREREAEKNRKKEKTCAKEKKREKESEKEKQRAREKEIEEKKRVCRATEKDTEPATVKEIDQLISKGKGEKNPKNTNSQVSLRHLPKELDTIQARIYSFHLRLPLLPPHVQNQIPRKFPILSRTVIKISHIDKFVGAF